MQNLLIPFTKSRQWMLPYTTLHNVCMSYKLYCNFILPSHLSKKLASDSTHDLENLLLILNFCFLVHSIFLACIIRSVLGPT
jgi:hypothetical protein